MAQPDEQNTPAKPARRKRKKTVALRLAGMSGSEESPAAGISPGIESLEGIDRPPEPGSFPIRCIDYGPGAFEEREFPTVDECIAAPRPPGTQIRWINVDGLHPFIVNQLRASLGFHTLAAEDVLRTPQRPKVEPYDGHLFIVASMLTWKEGHLHHEQLSIFLFKDTVLTLQESAGDCWDPIRQRLGRQGSRLRNNDTSYLVYAMLDGVVDHCFPILENYGERLEELESRVLDDPAPQVQRDIHDVKRELSALRRVIWPLRELVRGLQDDDSGNIKPAVKTYMRDVHDHAVQVMDIVETYREIAAGLNDLYMSAVSNRRNEIMKVLTIMASFFIPITFVAGVYGMNFNWLPELGWKYSYPVFWLVCLTIAGSLAYFFWRRGWIGGGRDRRR